MNKKMVQKLQENGGAKCSIYEMDPVKEKSVARILEKRALGHPKGRRSPSTRKIKILYITPSADLYGSDVCLLEMVKRLPKERFLPLVVLPYEGELFRELSRLKGIKIRILDLAVLRMKYMHPARFPVFLWKFFLSSLKLYRLIKKNRIDIVHSNSSMLQVGGIAAFLTGRPHIWHVREITLRPKILNTLLSVLLSKLSTKVLCITKTVRDSFVSLDGFQRKASVLYDSLELVPQPKTDNIQDLKRELGIEEGVQVVGTVGRINFTKGHKILMEAAELVLQRFPRAVFLVVGGADKRFGHHTVLEELKALVEKLRIREKVLFTGFRKDVWDLVSLMDVFVLPSLKPEGLGLSLIQAMALGKPAVATAQGGPLEIIEDQKTGILVPPGNPQILAEAIVDLLKHPQKRERIGRTAQEMVRQRFDFKKSGYMSKLERFYYQVLKEKKE